MNFWAVLLISLAVSLVVVKLSAYFYRDFAVRSLYVRGNDGSIVMLTGRGLMFTNNQSQVTCELTARGMYVYGSGIEVDDTGSPPSSARIPGATRIRLVVEDDGEAGLWLHRGVLLRAGADHDVVKQFTTSSHLQAVEARHREVQGELRF